MNHQQGESPELGNLERRVHGPHAPEMPGGYEGTQALIPLLTHSGCLEPASLRPLTQPHPTAWNPLPLPYCALASETEPFWINQWIPCTPWIGTPPDLSGGPCPVQQTGFQLDIAFLAPLCKQCKCGHIATIVVSSKALQEAVKHQVQLPSVLPIITTWQHSREHNKTSSNETPDGLVQDPKLLLQGS